ncbi:NB-ARC and TPR domain protein [Xylaria sp. FL1777]|nr:NB-ARC and TPR domain protein [Xylaria sp. FL1777]
MRHPNSSAESFSQQWSASVASMGSSLERQDRLRVSSVSSFDDVQGLFSSTRVSSLSAAALQELTALAHSLEKLKDFIDFVSNEAQPPTDNAIFWGLIGLVVYLSQSEEGVAPRGPCMLRIVCENIEFLNRYRGKAASLPELRDACFHIANSLLAWLVATIKFIREDVLRYSSDGWEPLEQQFNVFKSGIDDAISRLEKMSRLSGLDDLKQLQAALTFSNPLSHTQGPEEQAALPCFIYPASKTPRFFDRTEDIIQMDRHFKNGAQDANQLFRSLALYGIGGVGKSSVALRYAESRIHRKELDAMFWIASEKEVTIRQSFTDIAVRLKLPNAQPKDHDQNRTLVLDWLQDTECRWLLVFDNVESVDLLMTYWPTASCGQAVITTRNHNFAFYPADGGLEITEWDAETGSQFLVHLLSTDISNQLTQNEVHSAYELSSKLSGHALALSLMAGLIHRRSWSIDEFNEMYKRQPQKVHGQTVHGIFSNNSINAVWSMSFRSLNERASAILGVLTFLSPDSIPQALFEPKDPSVFPDSLEFCRDPFDFSNEMETLMTLALVKRNRERRTFSIHRLVQTSFKHFMSPEDRQRSFNDATLLVSAAFPRKDAEFAQMYHLWKPCSIYLPHVLSLKDSFCEERKSNAKFSALMLYCDLNNACQRYLIEINGYNDLLDLSEVNAMAIPTIPRQPHSIQVDLEGSLASHRGQVLARVGRFEEGIKQLKLSYDLFRTDQPRNLREEAWCAENLADGIASTNNFPEAVSFQEKARDHWLDWAKDNSEDKTEWPAILKWGMGTNLIWAGYNARSRDVLTHGLNQLEASKPYNWAMVAYTNYSLGTVDRADGNFESAERHFTQAYNKWISGDNLLSDPFCGACVYRMGCAALDQGKVESAIKHLREASVITERHKAKMPVEHARSLFKLSEALARKPREREEAEKLHKESTRLLLSRSPSTNDTDCEKAFDDLVFIWWR